MNLDQARFNMVEQQIRPWDVLDQTTLNAFRFLPREKFVHKQWQHLAFADLEIPIGHDEFMMHPRIEARMLQALAIQPTDQCLEIGTGSGFITACLAYLSQHVDSVDIYNDFLQQAEEKLQALSLNNITLYNDDTAQGWTGKPNKQYDVIAITGSLADYTPVFAERLALGGRLFMVIGQAPSMKAILITKPPFIEEGIERKVLFETLLKPLQNAEAKLHFQF